MNPPSADTFGYFIETVIKFTSTLTPFFVLSMFITMTGHMEVRAQRDTAIKTMIAITVICLFFYFFGKYLFTLFGITLDEFRIGAGAILFITGVAVVNGDKTDNPDPEKEGDICVVPMAIPFSVGPGTIGLIMVTSAETVGATAHAVTCGAILVSCLLTGGVLLISKFVERLIGKAGIKILSKITGLILAAIAAQLIFTGIKHILFATPAG